MTWQKQAVVPEQAAPAPVAVPAPAAPVSTWRRVWERTEAPPVRRSRRVWG